MKILLVISHLFLQSGLAIDLLNYEPLSNDVPLWPSQSHSSPPGDLWDSSLLDRPLPTNSWWLNLVLKEGKDRITSIPYHMSVQNDGLHVCLPDKTVQPTYITTAFIDNLIMGTTGQVATRKVVAFDELSVTVQWSGSGGTMKAALVRGMPYVTVDYQGLVPSLRTIHAILKVNGQPAGGTVSGRKFSVEMNNGQTWLIYASADITFTTSISTLMSSSPFTGSLRAAVSTAPEAEAVLDAYSQRIPTGGKVEAVSSGDVATLSFIWQSTGTGDLLMMALPHHLQVLGNGEQKPQLRINTMKGDAIGIVADRWTMDEELTKIEWNTPRGIPGDKLQAIKEALAADIDKGVEADDTYFGGKQMAAIARLALIAEEVGDTNLATSYRQNLKYYLEPWLMNTHRLVYDHSWGGVVDVNGINDPQANFGMGYYNDHHFHFGYFVYAAAVLVKQEPDWGYSYGNVVMNLIRDYSNPAPGSGDVHFTHMRNKDWFVGHSWAAGLFSFADARNQESTSEAANAWYAIYLYGLASNNTRLKDVGRLALATEMRSVANYWQITADNPIYPAPFADNKVVGILWSTKVDYATFFGANTEFIHCIQMLPFTPISEELLRPKWIQEEYPVLSTALGNGGLSEGWKGFIYMAHAIIDKQAAWNEAQSLNTFDDGNSKTNTLYWIATRP